MTGSLQAKKLADGKMYYYMVLNFYDKKTRKRKQKWISTGLCVTGNKRKAEQMLRQELVKYTSNEFDGTSEMLFSDWVSHWLDMKKGVVELSTYESYSLSARHIMDYFGDRKLRLIDLKPHHFEEFYHEMLTEGKVNQKTKERSGLAVRTVRSQKSIINSALNDAVVHEIIQRNPAAGLNVTNKRKKSLAKKIVFFSSEEANDFLRFVYEKEDILADMIYVALYFGLRRSEVLGLTEGSLDFERHLLYINRTVVKVKTQYTKNRTKTPDSNGVFHLTQELEDFFKGVLKKKKENKQFFGNTYSQNPELFVWEDGHTIAPDYVYHHFKKLVKEFGRPDMTFHALRHSTASLLASRGWHPKEIQEWLRHADFYTTMNIYTHLDQGRLVERSERLTGILKNRMV